MNTKTSKALCCLTVVGALCCSIRSTCGAEMSAEELTYAVPFELGDAAFVPGDAIVIQDLRGSTNTIAIGHTYLVTGTYTLSSRDEAQLAFYVSSRTASGPSLVDPRQVVRVKKGTGTFALMKTMQEEGYPHLSFYPTSSGGDLGGVYFGQGDSVLRNRGSRIISPSSQQEKLSSARDSSGSSFSWTASEANRVLLNYLGSPVDPPANLDQAYNKDGLTKAVQFAAQQAGITLKKIAIEDSEFPFLIGVISEKGDSPKLKEQLKKMEGYTYGGGVGDDTCNAFNIIPWPAFPQESSQRISHRLMLREQVFHDRLQAQE
jgi:hypothetical protein